MQDTDLMLHTLLELGESMLADGADVRRVEQTLSRMGKAYGAVRMDVFVITSSIVLTMCFADGSAATQTRRIEKTGGLICLACRLVPALHSDKVIIGDIMLLIPGLAFTNAFKDIFIGDTISGVMRLIETILWAAALALGFALAGWLLGV